MDKLSIMAYLSIAREKIKNMINEILRSKNVDGVFASHGLVLFVLYSNDGKVQLKNLAKIIGKRKSTVTDLIKKLVESGLVEKIESEVDKRVSYAVLTEEAYKFKAIFDEISQALKERCFKGMSDEDIENLDKYLKTINSNLE